MAVATEPKPKVVERDIPEDHLSLLKRCCGGGPPAYVIEEYWQYRAMRDRVDVSTVQPHELLGVAFQAMKRRGEPIHDNPAKPYNALEACKKGWIEKGQALRVHWRGAEHRGHLIEALYNSQRITVTIEGVERKVDAKSILGPWREIEEPATTG